MIVAVVVVAAVAAAVAAIVVAFEVTDAATAAAIAVEWFHLLVLPLLPIPNTMIHHANHHHLHLLHLPPLVLVRIQCHHPRLSPDSLQVWSNLQYLAHVPPLHHCLLPS